MEDGRVENEGEAKRKPRRFYAVSRLLKRANATTTASRMTSNPRPDQESGVGALACFSKRLPAPGVGQDSRNLNRPQERASLGGRLELSLGKP